MMISRVYVNYEEMVRTVMEYLDLPHPHLSRLLRWRKGLLPRGCDSKAISRQTIHEVPLLNENGMDS